MRLTKLVPLLAVLCGCANHDRAILIDDLDRPPAPAEKDDRFAAPDGADKAEREAADAIRDIERRVQTGELPKIEFEFDKADITPESRPTLDLIAQVMLTDDHLKLMIRAHCDSIGSDEYNLDLSQRRAKSVSDYLAARGVQPPSMRFHGYGRSRPIADNATDEGRAKNRRVEFYIMTRDWRTVY